MRRRPPATPDQLATLGARIRELREAAGISEKELGEPNFSEAYITALEAGQHDPSEGALQFLAHRLQVTAGELRTDAGADWGVQLAKHLWSKGNPGGLALVLEVMAHLDRHRQVSRRALVVLRREVGKLALADGECDAAADHFVASLDLVGDDPTLAADQAETLVRLGDVRLAQGETAEALTLHHTASHLLLDLIGRSLDQRGA